MSGQGSQTLKESMVMVTFFNIYLFYVAVQGVSRGMWDLLVEACKLLVVAMLALVPWPGIKPRPPALGAWSLNHWTTSDGVFKLATVVPECVLEWKMEKVMKKGLSWEVIYSILHSFCS